MTVIHKNTTKPSLRSSNPTKSNSLGIIRTPRKLTSVSWQDIMIPAKITYGVFRNDGTNDIRIRFNNQDPTNFWTISAGQTSPTIKLGQDRTKLHYKSEGGPSDLECMLWSE